MLQRLQRDTAGTGGWAGRNPTAGRGPQLRAGGKSGGMAGYNILTTPVKSTRQETCRGVYHGCRNTRRVAYETPVYTNLMVHQTPPEVFLAAGEKHPGHDGMNLTIGREAGSLGRGGPSASEFLLPSRLLEPTPPLIQKYLLKMGTNALKMTNTRQSCMGRTWR